MIDSRENDARHALVAADLGEKLKFLCDLKQVWLSECGVPFKILQPGTEYFGQHFAKAIDLSDVKAEELARHVQNFIIKPMIRDLIGREGEITAGNIIHVWGQEASVGCEGKPDQKKLSNMCATLRAWLECSAATKTSPEERKHLRGSCAADMIKELAFVDEKTKSEKLREVHFFESTPEWIDDFVVGGKKAHGSVKRNAILYARFVGQALVSHTAEIIGLLREQNSAVVIEQRAAWYSAVQQDCVRTMFDQKREYTAVLAKHSSPS